MKGSVLRAASAIISLLINKFIKVDLLGKNLFNSDEKTELFPYNYILVSQFWFCFPNVCM